MEIEDKRTRGVEKPIGSLPIETVVQFLDDRFVMIVSHDLQRGITGYYDFRSHALWHVLDDSVVIPCKAKLVIEGGGNS